MTAELAADFLVDVVGRLSPDSDPAPIRAMVGRACGGQLKARAPDGRRACGLTASGVPFEASVSGGRGNLTPAIRYTTETATQETEFGTRVAAQRDAIRDLVAWLPGGGQTVTDMLWSFISALYPEPATLTGRYRSATWIGVVQDISAPHHAIRLKVYGFPHIVPGALTRLCSEWPGFAGLVSLPEDEKLFEQAFLALEVDADGGVHHKVYLRARRYDVAVPMLLIRYFGDPAWQLLSELVRCGADAAELHQHRYFVCCARGAGEPVFTLHMGAGRREDLTGLARELASRHHGTTHGVDTLARAAESSGAGWRYSAIGLGFSNTHGIDKLNVYGTPFWNAA
ncbi:hypothetical protein [Nocardia sp. NBC_01329]|uniref:hypothetical protein n=1 Tax=Nocardia sp. NBC_01329 TaxID=2903594 RepID=UPI002E14C96D|nr:hypothetical protein OG405_20110 [Nocardia sp. NBC_01329]